MEDMPSLRERGEKARPVLGSCLPPWSTEGRLLAEIRESAVSLEELMLPVAKRRMLCISQVLATATAAFLNKLALAEEGVIAPAAAQQWLECGVLMVAPSLPLTLVLTLALVVLTIQLLAVASG